MNTPDQKALFENSLVISFDEIERESREKTKQYLHEASSDVFELFGQYAENESVLVNGLLQARVQYITRLYLIKTLQEAATDLCFEAGGIVELEKIRVLLTQIKDEFTGCK